MSLTPLSLNTVNSPSDIASQRLAVDPSALEGLRVQASHDPKAAIKGVASQFEAMFLGTLMKQMRETSFDDDDNSSEMSTYRSLLDEQLVQSMSKAGGVGLGAMLAQQIARVAGVDGDKGAPDVGRTQPTQTMTPSFTRALQAYRASDPAAATTAAAGNAKADDLAASQNGFVASLLPQAQAAADKLGVSPNLLVAHAALETGWGKRALRHPDGRNSHNLFGIKAGSNWSGPTVNVTTTEYVGGVAQKRVETFRAYASYRESFEDYARMLGENPRYRGVLNQGGNAEGFAGALQSGGYATDPAYARKLATVAASVLGNRNHEASSLQLASR